MPVISARGNFAGLDTRRGFADSSLNSCSDMRNIQLREKSIKKRLGHQKLHDDAVKGSSLCWSEFGNEIPLEIDSPGAIDSGSGWSFEFAFRIDKLPTGGTPRKITNGYLVADVSNAGVLRVGSDTGGGPTFLTAATTIVIDTTFFVSVTYDPAGAGTLIVYIDGVSDATDAAYGTPNDPDETQGLFIGSRGGLLTGGALYIADLRIWDDTRTPAEVDAFDGVQIPTEIVSNEGADLVHYYRMDDGSGFVLSDIGNSNQDITFCADPFVEGIVDGSLGALRDFDGRILAQNTSSGTTVVGDNWGYFQNANDMTWEFAINFTALPAVATGTHILFRIDESPGADHEVIFRIIVSGADYLFEFFYEDNDPAGDNATVTSTTTITEGTTFHVALTVDRDSGVDRDFRLYIDGVEEDTDLAVTDGGSDSNPTNTRLINELGPPAAGEGVDYTVDEMRLWGITRTTDDVDNTKGRILHEGEITDDLYAYYKFEERDRNGFMSSVSGDANFNNPPHLVAELDVCPEWAFGLVVKEDPCIRGIHNYIDPKSNTNEVIIQGDGATWKIDETTSLLTQLQPFFPQGNGVVNSSRFGRSGSRSYFADGATLPWRYDGTNLHQVGILPPTQGPIFSSSSAGTEWPAGDYSIAYSFLGTGPDREYESSLSPSTAFTLGSAQDDLVIQIPDPKNDPQVDSYRIYLTKTDGTVLFLSQDFEATLPGLFGGFVSLTVSNTEDDLIIAEVPNREPPLRFKFMVERDGRMIWSGDPFNERLIFFSEVDFPEYIGSLNFIEHFEEVTALAVGANNELVIFGRTGRRLLLGDISNVLTPVRDFRNGGCLSHGSLENIEGWIYGLGVDGPFRTNAQTYQTVDEIFSSGRVSGSIRQQLEDVTDKTEWDRAQSSYDLDRKTWYLTIPASDFSTTDAYRVFPLQWDIPAWTRYTDWACDGAIARRRDADESFHKTLGSALRGFVCEIEEEGFKDGLADADAHSFTVLSVDTGADSVTLTATPTSTGDGVKGLPLFEFNSTNNTITFIGNVTFQNGATLFLDADPAALVATDIVFLGVYEAFYQTKSLDARTTTRRKKLWRWIDFDQNEETTGSLLLEFARIDDAIPTFQTVTKDASLDQSQSRDLRFGMNLGTERLIIQFGTVEPNPMEVFGFDVNYEQMGVT